MPVPTAETVDERLVALFKALGNPVRYQLVRYMVAHPQCITGELAAFADLAQSTTSQHLAVLREAGLVQGSVAGPATCYCLDLEVLAWFRDRVAELATELSAACCACPPGPGASHPTAVDRPHVITLNEEPGP